MAKLQFKTTGFEQHEVELKFGLNRLGRAADNEVQLDHPTVSSEHCEIRLDCDRLSVRDSGSTNGTFVEGTRVLEARLLPGQTLRLGEVEFLVVDAVASISIPKFEAPSAPMPVTLPNGTVTCRRHWACATAYECQHCHELLCPECIHRLRRRGGQLLCLCPLCSYPVTALKRETPKRSFFGRLCQTTRLLFNRALARN